MPDQVTVKKPTFRFDIDILGNCNRRCPSRDQA